jgi:hypothetical protein
MVRDELLLEGKIQYLSTKQWKNLTQKVGKSFLKTGFLSTKNDFFEEKSVKKTSFSKILVMKFNYIEKYSTNQKKI